MSTEVNGTKMRYETILSGIRKEASKIRDANYKLLELRDQLSAANHPAPAARLDKSSTVIDVALDHLREVFREF